MGALTFLKGHKVNWICKSPLLSGITKRPFHSRFILTFQRCGVPSQTISFSCSLIAGAFCWSSPPDFASSSPISHWWEEFGATTERWRTARDGDFFACFTRLLWIYVCVLSCFFSILLLCRDTARFHVPICRSLLGLLNTAIVKSMQCLTVKASEAKNLCSCQATFNRL